MRQITDEQLEAIRRGEKSVLSRKLKAKHVVAIRKLFVQTSPGGVFRGRYGLTMERVAREYGVTDSTISDIVKRRTWRHLT